MPEPLSIFDIKREEIAHKLNGGEETIIVKGLTAKDYYGILQRFRRLAVLALGGRANIFDALIDIPEAMAAWVAAAVGEGGNPLAEKAALESLTAEQALGIVEASFPLTFTHGFGPFYDLQTSVMATLLPIPLGKESGTTSPPPSTPVEDSSIPVFGN